MTDESVVVDNGQTYVSEESAVMANEAADRAKQWAEESETQANLATNSANISYQARNEAVNIANGFTQRVTEATNTFNSNATAKTNDFNNNATAKTTAFNDNYTEKKALIDAQVEIAESSATNANNYKNKAREWAISQNIVDNEDYSSKYWAKKAEEWAESVVNVANKDLSNLNPQGQNIANWSSNVTNCITEIPQDIKLELNNGKLTLKEGSKVYVPNGFEADGTTKKFDEVVINSNLSIPNVAGSGKVMVYARASGFAAFLSLVSKQASGDDATSVTSGVYYDTSTNIIKKWSNGVVEVNKASLPLAIATLTEGVVTSIDQVFNGFGYIGSTVFALPGVKGLIPNGRNADGSLKSIEFTVDKPIIFSSNPRNTSEPQMLLFDSGLNIKGPTTIGTISYNEVDNYTIYNGTNKSWVSLLTFVYNNDKITFFKPKTAFHALDYNDSPTISGWGMPSNRYIDLTLGASGSTYRAPANGYFCFNGRDSGNTGTANVVLRNQTRYFGVAGKNLEDSPAWNGYILPAKKGDLASIFYFGTLAFNDTNWSLGFYFAEGEN